MTTIAYVTGDATRPEADGPAIVAHVCNDIGGWGSGFVLAVSARWPEPEQGYRAWHQSGKNFTLGYAQLVPVGGQLWVANMIAQHGTASQPADDGLPPVRYRALGQCLRSVAAIASDWKASVHMPRIGCGLAGGRWDLVEPIIDWSLCRPGIPVTVYDLPGSPEARWREPLGPGARDGSLA